MQTGVLKSLNRTIVLLLICGIVAISIALEFEPSEHFQLGALALAIMTLGMPHGAFDVPILFRSKTPVKGFCLYAALALVFPALWWVSEPLWFFGFFVLTFVHFGQTDLSSSRLPRGDRFLLVVARYGILFFAPAAFDYAGYASLLSHVLSPELIEFVFGKALFIFALCIFVSLYFLVKTMTSKGDNEIEFLELLTIIVLASSLPVLLSFAVYFCLIHSLRHLSNIERHLDKVSMVFSFSASLIILFLAAFLWISYGLDLQSSNDAVLLVMLGFSSLTLPHMLLHLFPKTFIGEPLQ